MTSAPNLYSDCCNAPQMVTKLSECDLTPAVDHAVCVNDEIREVKVAVVNEYRPPTAVDPLTVEDSVRPCRGSHAPSMPSTAKPLPLPGSRLNTAYPSPCRSSRAWNLVPRPIQSAAWWSPRLPASMLTWRTSDVDRVKTFYESARVAVGHRI